MVTFFHRLTIMMIIIIKFLSTDMLLPTGPGKLVFHLSFGHFWEEWSVVTGSMRSLMNVSRGGGPCGSPAEHSGIYSISGACAVYRWASSSRHFVLSCRPNIITLQF